MSESGAATDCHFLSYSRADSDFALRFATDLRNRGVSMWVDQLDIRPSEHWDRAIERAVRDCRGLVVIISPRSIASDNVADEISFAIDSGKSVLPVMIEKCTLPLRITRMQVIDATRDYERALEQCLGAIGDGEGLPQTTPPKGIDDPELIAQAKEKLTGLLGPIAAILVDKTAARARSATEFHTLLGEHIDSDKDRQAFLAQGGVPGPAVSSTSRAKPTGPGAARSTVAASEVERLASLLTHYLGPIAEVIARRESAGASSVDELQQRLALLIPNERERRDFLGRSGASR